MLLHAHARPGLPGAGGRLVLILALLAIVVEALWRARSAGRGYDMKAAAATLGVAAGDLMFGGLGAGVIAAAYAFVWRLAPVRWPLGDWRTWAAGFVLVEFAYYWFHRLSHEVRWLWATHAVHHTPEQITLLSSLRLGWTNLFSGGWLVYLPLVLAGFDPRLVLGVLALDLHYQFFLHTEARLSFGPLERILNTPAHHRLHHASNPAYLDRNYGGMVIIFDRLFGTFAAEQDDEPARFGLAHPYGTQNPLRLALGEWLRMLADLRRSDGLAARLKVALGRPA
jgi:sterol desaturase/sphingolipid hydroxylase (fatty acid hydroxylase superfamily)